MLAKKTSKNQITIPKSVLREIPDATYFEVTARTGEIVLRPVQMTSAQDDIRVVREKVASLGLKEDVVDEAVRWARRRK